MKVYVYYFDNMGVREIAYAMSGFYNQIVAIAKEKRVYESCENIKVVPDITVAEVDPDDVDLLIIPGGNPDLICSDEGFKKLVLKLNEKGKYISGICAGAMAMARFGILDNKRGNGDAEGFVIKTEVDREAYKNVKIVPDGVVVDGNCITAISRAAIEFAVELSDVMGVYKNEQERKEDYDWLKYLDR